MKTTYTYKEQTYSNLYELSEALGKDGVFIPFIHTKSRPTLIYMSFPRHWAKTACLSRCQSAMKP